MPFWDFISGLFSKFSAHFFWRTERRYDNVQVVNLADGTTIKGHENVRDYLEHEKKLRDEYGQTLTFQVYVMNLQADTIEKLQGGRLAEFSVDGGFVSGNDTVAIVKDKLRDLITGRGSMRVAKSAIGDLALGETDCITLYLGDNPMDDDSLFYADNFVMLPAWIQILIHRCGQEAFLRIVARLTER